MNYDALKPEAKKSLTSQDTILSSKNRFNLAGKEIQVKYEKIFLVDKNIFSENAGKIVYSSLCNRKFEKEHTELLSKELWSVRSMLTMINFSFDPKINIEHQERSFDRIQSRAFSRANA